MNLLKLYIKFCLCVPLFEKGRNFHHIHKKVNSPSPQTEYNKVENKLSAFLVARFSTLRLVRWLGEKIRSPD